MKQKYTSKHKEEALKEMAKGETRQLNVVMQARDYKKFGMKCMELDTNMSDWVRSKIDELINPKT